MKKITMIGLAVMLACLAMACSHNNSTPDPNQGFLIQVAANGFPTVAQVHGDFIGGNPTTGSLEHFDIETFGAGFTPVRSTKVPGTWHMIYGPSIGSLCLGFATVDRNVSLGSLETLPCAPRYFSFTAAPNTIDASNPVATVDVTGTGSNNLTGTPMIAFYNEFGNVVASGPANQLLYTNGAVSGVRVGTADLSQAYDGTYTGLVHNVNANGTWDVIGAAVITVYGNPPPPPIDPGDGGGGSGCISQPRGQEQLPCDTYNNY